MPFVDQHVEPSTPKVSVHSLPPKAHVKKKDGKRILYDSERRQSARLRASAEGCLKPDPRMGIGKPRGKSARKLKELAVIANLSTESVLNDSDFLLDCSVNDTGSFTNSSPSDCSVLSYKRWGVEMCGLNLEDVAESKLQGEKLLELPRPTDDAEQSSKKGYYCCGVFYGYAMFWSCF